MTKQEESVIRGEIRDLNVAMLTRMKNGEFAGDLCAAQDILLHLKFRGVLKNINWEFGEQ